MYIATIANNSNFKPISKSSNCSAKVALNQLSADTTEVIHNNNNTTVIILTLNIIISYTIHKVFITYVTTKYLICYEYN